MKKMPLSKRKPSLSDKGLEHLMFSLGLGQIELEHGLEEHHQPFHMTNKNNEELKKYFEEETKIFLTNDHDFIHHTRITKADSQTLLKQDTIDSENIDFINPNKRDDDMVLEFKEMHDPRHRHPRENDAFLYDTPVTANVCLTPKSLLSLVINHNDLHMRKFYNAITSSMASTSALKFVKTDDHNLDEEYNDFINNVKLTPVAFMKLCPALLAQVDQQVCVRPAPQMNTEDQNLLLWNAWMYASGSIFVLSACGLLGVLLVPLMKTKMYNKILKFLVSIAVGTLSGDALMHLLPHALSTKHGFNKEDVQKNMDFNKQIHDNAPVWICACAFGAAVFMYILENLVPMLKKDKSDGQHHGHSHRTKGLSNNDVNLSALETDVMETNAMLNALKEDRKVKSPPLSPVAFMVIVGDGLHNLTDGLAIGAAFASDPVTGIATAFAVLCHELPHELGDFALLLQVGVPIRRIICLNIISSVLSFVGMAIGLVISSLHTSTTQWVYAITAGSFLYIAFADLMPAMGTEAKRTIKDVLIQIVGLLSGGVVMLIIAVNENDLEMLFK